MRVRLGGLVEVLARRDPWFDRLRDAYLEPWDDRSNFARPSRSRSASGLSGTCSLSRTCSRSCECSTRSPKTKRHSCPTSPASSRAASQSPPPMCRRLGPACGNDAPMTCQASSGRQTGAAVPPGRIIPKACNAASHPMSHTRHGDNHLATVPDRPTPQSYRHPKSPTRLDRSARRVQFQRKGAEHAEPVEAIRRSSSPEGAQTRRG